MTEKGWRARADEAFLVQMPGRPRVLAEVLLLLALVMGHGLSSRLAAALLAFAELAFALALVRPWARLHGGQMSRAVAWVVVIVAVVVPAMIELPNLAGAPRHLGVALVPATPGTADGAVGGGVTEVASVEAGSAADGVLARGDRIVAIAGSPLERTNPVSDLTRRTHSDELPEDTTVSVIRDGVTRELQVHIPRVHGAARTLGPRLNVLSGILAQHLILAAAVRGALVIALILLLLRANGQSTSTLGIARVGMARELVAASWMTAGAFAVQIAMAIPIAAIGAMFSGADREGSQRLGALRMIADQGSLPEIVVGLGVAAAFEELAFRGFLVPRMRMLTGSWGLAIGLVSVVFGIGHLYEGAMAVAQTALLGVYFSILLLWRRRIVGPIVAHATFNAFMLLLVRVILQSGAIEKLKELTPK